ncbi:MAG TPA: chemotaxis protein CheB [Candidatus Binatia bacterium]|nr:chemotaxis protein CheB [Candidatus Binatia bacterium]
MPDSRATGPVGHFPGAADVSRFDVVVVGASAGGLKPLTLLLGLLPQDFPLPILVVMHVSKRSPGLLPTVLGWRCKLTVKWAEDMEALRAATVYVAPPDRHLLISNGMTVQLSSAERVNWWRPAVDALFHSAAAVCSDRTIAIVLSGALYDGAKGVAAVASAGGITIAQDEASAEFFDMPSAALDLGRADIAMSPAKMAEALQILAAQRS